ncbi:sensor histidine kinase [Galbitalea soli]|uniref:Oxygen sensor histidine kinase NreB n=1 Tax=Galbitalea soli TaxID=1268042 RepID=A0A7C9TRC8_9MICO|nr:sensor histidine kinase [Galbitalea soli]NEM92096.1 sensor histidine kinase [Galbitalea soli]NYJ31952.1 signal transduction histidine kinase [Galbitalea soli]
MDDQRWWHVAVVATALVLGVLVAVGHTAAWRVAGVAACNALLVIAWFAVGQRARRRNPALAVPFVAAVILIVGTATAFSPTMATAQCLAYPLVWTFLERLRHAVSADIALAAAVGIGLYLSTGSLVQAIVVQGLSLVFSLSLGLWITSIANRSDERHRLLLELEAAQEKLTALSRDAGAVEERERLVREIHDTIAQDLTGLVLTAQRGLRELRGGDPTAAEAQLEVLEEIARNALAETRALVASGAAVGIDGSGLDASLRHLAERFERETGMTVRVTVDHSPALDRDHEVVVLRCAQEALANVRKHAAARRVELSLAGGDDGVTLSVRDDGVGFDPAAAAPGFGLAGMRERLALAGGELQIESATGAGSTLRVRLPAGATA